MKFETLT